MKKIFLLILICVLSANVSYAKCSVTGGACKISDLINESVLPRNKHPESLLYKEKIKLKETLPYSVSHKKISPTVCKISECFPELRLLNY